MSRRLTALVAAASLVFSVWLANYLVNRYAAIRVWPTDLLAPAGVYVIGLAFLLRDTAQRFGGQTLALAAVAAGAGMSALVSTGLAEASAAGFAASETIGLVFFWLLRGNQAGARGLAIAVVVSSGAAAAVDSYVFLTIAFHSLAFIDGQLVAKLTVTAAPRIRAQKLCFMMKDLRRSAAMRSSLM